MKQTLLIITALMLIVGCSKTIDGNTLIRSTGDLMYAPGSDKPYSGVAVWYYENGQKGLEGTHKNGERDGLWTGWYENGQKSGEATFKDGELDGLFTYWNENGQKKNEETYKDGEELGKTQWDYYKNGQKSWERTYKDGEKIFHKFSCFEFIH